MRGFAAIGLDYPKNPINVGHVLRAAQCFDVKAVFTSGRRYRRASTDTLNSTGALPLVDGVADLRDVIPHGCVPVAVDLVAGAKPLPTYCHPERAFYVFGPEDGTLGHRVLSWCREVLYVPAGCLNLAACVNVVLYDRLVKRREWDAADGIGRHFGGLQAKGERAIEIARSDA